MVCLSAAALENVRVQRLAALLVWLKHTGQVCLHLDRSRKAIGMNGMFDFIVLGFMQSF